MLIWMVKGNSYIFLFLLFSLIGVLGVFGYKFFDLNKEPVVLGVINNIKESNFSIEKAPKESLKGKITETRGEVLWQSRTASEAAVLEILPSELQQGEAIGTGENGGLRIDFPDTLKVTLAQKTQIDFIQTLPINIVIAQEKGNASYERTGESPITIRIMHLLLEEKEKGTQVEVEVGEESSEVNISVIKGGVSFAFNNLNNVTKIFEFKGGQKATFKDQERSLLEVK